MDADRVNEMAAPAAVQEIIARRMLARAGKRHVVTVFLNSRLRPFSPC